MRSSLSFVKKSISKKGVQQQSSSESDTPKNLRSQQTRKDPNVYNKLKITREQLTDINTDETSLTEELPTTHRNVSNPNTQIPRVRTLSDYAKFQEMPIYHPTIDEFSDPFKLIRTLYEKGFDEIGAVKIIPPKQWNSTFSFPNINKKFPTRSQIIGELSKGKPFEEKRNSFNLSEFKIHAESFSNSYKFQVQETKKSESKERRDELEFWSIVDNPQSYSEVKVDYAADLSSRNYGSCFEPSSKESIKQFNLNRINSTHNSLFQPVRKKDYISGINSPWVYFGMLFSTFCFHVEDLFMFALNYLHEGCAKTWYTIPEKYMKQFEEVYEQTYKNIFSKDKHAMSSMNLQLNPAIALEAGIPVYRTDQQAGQFILTFPKVYHGGFSHGFNCGEAVNVVTPEWFKYYYEAKQQYLKTGLKKPLPFPLSWLLTNIVTDVQQGSYDVVFLNAVKQQWQKIVEEELIVRKSVMITFENKIRQKQQMVSRENYDKNICSICKEYCYLSHIECHTCNKQCCSSHITPCSCLKQNVTLFIRFTQKEFENQLSTLNEILAKKN